MGLFDWLKPTPPIDTPTRALVERAVATVDPLIRQVGGYEQRLAPVVCSAYDYCAQMALAIPGPIPINRAAFASDPLIHALFGSADGIETMLATSQCIRDFISRQDALMSDQCCALLGMRPKITAGFGTRLHGEIIQRDEPQKTLTFTDHTLAEPGLDLDAAHRHLAERMFDGLIKGFVAHVDEVREERQDLRSAEAMERTRARSAGPEAHTRRRAELQERLHETSDALQPDRLTETLAAYLAKPDTLLRLEPVKLAVNRVGVLVDRDEDLAQADMLDFVELTTRDLRRWVVLIVTIDREEARAAFERFDERRRYIVI